MRVALQCSRHVARVDLHELRAFGRQAIESIVELIFPGGLLVLDVRDRRNALLRQRHVEAELLGYCGLARPEQLAFL